VSDEKPDLHVVESGRSDASLPDGDDVFSATELRFIDALVEGKTIKSAAHGAGIAYTTARRLRRRPDVQAVIRERAREAVQAGTLALGQAARTAARTLKNVAAKGGPGDGPRVSAARAILEIGSKALEIEDIESRLAELEARRGQQPGAPGFRRN
jgi:hypothetical protein